MQTIKIFLVSLILGLSTLYAGKPLEIWVNSQTDKNYYENMVKLYQKKKDKKFSAIIKSFGFMEMPDKLGIAFKSGINVPDIVQLDEATFSMYLHGESPFVELTDRIKKTTLTSSILPQRMGLFAFGGKTWGIPQSVSAVVIYYRTDMFREVGVDPLSITTWDEFLKAGAKIKNAERSLLALDWSYFEILLRQRGFDLFDAQGKPQLTTPEAIETLEWIVKMAESGIGRNPDRGHIFDPTFFSGDVANGEVMMIMGPGWYGLDMLSAMTPEDTKGKWKAMPLPVWTDSKSKSTRNTSTFSGQGLLMTKAGKDKDAAWDFIRWIIEDQDANAERFLEGNCFTPYKPAWLDMRFSKKNKAFGDQSLGNLMLEVAGNIPGQAQSPLRGQFLYLFRENYWNSIMGGGMTAKQALQELQGILTKKK